MRTLAITLIGLIGLTPSVAEGGSAGAAFDTVADIDQGARVAPAEPSAIPDGEPITIAEGHVTDGDTVHVTLVTGQRVDVRLADIDAPEVAHGGESGQPGGAMAERFLARLLVKHSRLRLIDSGNASYGRVVGRVQIHVGQQGQNTCMALSCPPAGEWRRVAYPLVAAGMAWVNPRYNDSERLAATMERARGDGEGLWGLEADAVAPWEWRH